MNRRSFITTIAAAISAAALEQTTPVKRMWVQIDMSEGAEFTAQMVSALYRTVDGLKVVWMPPGQRMFQTYDAAGNMTSMIAMFFSSDGVVPDNGDFSDWPKYKVAPVHDGRHHGFQLVRI